MLAAVADTHALIWYLYDDPGLSSSARTFMEAAAHEGDEIALSSITFVEMVYLIEKGRIPAESMTLLASTVTSGEGLFVEVPVNLDVVRALAQVDGTAVPDMPDRIVAATAILLNVPVISRDRKIYHSAIQTIW